jgi:hypothetical protein
VHSTRMDGTRTLGGELDGAITIYRSRIRPPFFAPRQLSARNR